MVYHRSSKSFNEQNLKEIKEWAVDTVINWHENARPDYVFLTDSSGTSYGWVLKEAWKSAYGKEKMPAFYRIDPRAIDTASKETVKNYFERRVKKKNPRVIVFDEGDPSEEYTGVSDRPNENLVRTANFIRTNIQPTALIEEGSAPSCIRNVSIDEYPGKSPLSKLKF